MSYISSPPGTALTTAEIAVIVSLTNLVVSPAGQAVKKTSTTDFSNASTGAAPTWYQSEVLILQADRRTFVLQNAPTATVFLLGGHQPQVYGIDFTGTINGVNKTFIYAAQQDASILTDQYATYQ